MEARVAGAHGALCTRDPSDMLPPQLLRHQHSSVDSPTMAVPQSLTVLRLPKRTTSTLPLLTLRTAMDQRSSAPCLVRVRARVLKVLPTDPRLWTTATDAQGAAMAGGDHSAAWSYGMVLQLGDAEEENVYVGACLVGEEAEHFFPGLPAADLHKSNATLAALRARVAALEQAGPSEFCLWAFRPSPSDLSDRGVAYHIVGTQCVHVNSA